MLGKLPRKKFDTCPARRYFQEMLKQILSLIILGAVLFVFYNEFLEIPFVNKEELTATRENAVTLAQQGKHQQSLIIFKSLLKVAPEDKYVWGDYLLVMISAGNEDQAYQLAKKNSIELIPEYALKEIFELALFKNDMKFAQQIALYEIGISGSPYQVAIERAYSFSEINNYSGAQSLIEYARQQSTEGKLALDNAEIIILNKSDPYLAQQKIISLLSENKITQDDLWQIYVDYWVNQARKGNVNQALMALEPYLDEAPKKSHLTSDYFVLLTWDHQYDEAEALYDNELSSKQLNPYVISAAANTMYKQGRLEEAKDLYQELLRLDAENFEYKKGLAKVYVELGQAANALTTMQPLSALVDNDARVIIGLAQQQLGRDDEALASLSSALNSKQINDAATYRVWLHSFKSELPKKSFNQLWPRYSIPLNAAPEDVVRFIKNAEIKYSNLTVANKKTKKIRSPLESMRFNASIARQQEQSKKATLIYNQALAISPNDKDLQLGLALALIDLYESQQSNRILSSLSQSYPNDRQIMDAYVYYAQQFDRDEILLTNLRGLAEISNGIEQDSYIQSWISAVINNKNLSSTDAKLIELSKFSNQQNLKVLTARVDLTYADRRCDQVKSIVSEIDISDLNSDQIESIAFILRDCGHSQLAFNYYKAGMVRYSEESVFFAGGILTSIKLGDMQRANKIAECCLSQFKDNTDFTMAKAYLRFHQKKFRDALKLYNHVLLAEPSNHEAYVGSIMSQAELNMSEESFSAAREYQPGLSADQWQRLYELRIRQTLVRAKKADEPERIAYAQSATEIIDDYLIYISQSDPNNDTAKTNALLNQVYAKTLAAMPAEAVTIFESLTISKNELPLWGVLYAADAYVKNRQPEMAAQLLADANESNPDDLSILSALYFALLDMEDYKSADKAMLRMNTIVEDQEVVDGKAHWVKRLDAMFQAYQNRLQSAEDRLLRLQEKAPNDINLLKNLATVYRWRGWVEKSNHSLDLLDKKGDKDIANDVARSHLLMDSQQYALASLGMKQFDQHSFNNDVKNLKSRWQLHNKRQYRAIAQYGESSGNALGNKDFIFEQRLYSAPIQHKYRLYARDRYDWAEFPEDNGNLHRIGLGGELRQKSYNVSAEINTSVRDNTNVGVTVSGTWRHDDYLSVFGEVQTFSRYVPLRAINANIEGESISTGVQYRWNEMQHIRAAVTYTDFSDGNKRSSLYLSHEHSVFQNSHHQVFLGEEIYTSKNTKNDVGYFNPDEDFSLRVAAKYRGIIWRRYEKSLTHRLDIGVGNYKQKNESNAGIWDIEYKHQWKPDSSLEIDYGVLHRRRTYDGDAESYNAVSASINWRF